MIPNRGSIWILVLLVIVVSARAAPERKTRGIVDEAGKWWHDVFNIDGIQHAAERQAQRLKPWAERVEAEMGPAMKRVEESLGTAFDSLADSFSTRYRPSLRRGPDGSEDPERKPPTSGPGLYDFMFGGQSALDPFAIFGVSRRKWWEGENVCVDRKVVQGDDEEKAEEAAEDEEDKKVVNGKASDAAQRKSRYFDMSFTTCRDEENVHECTTHINADGVKETITLRYECCYGYTRDPEGPGCILTAFTDLRTVLKDLGATSFTELLETSNLDGNLDKNMSVFAPTNEAVEDFRHDLQKLNAVEYEVYNVDDGLTNRRKRATIEVAESAQLEDVLKGHLIPGFVDSVDFQDESMLDTVLTSENGSKLRINIYNTYPTKTIMANCAKVSSADHYSTNGVVHVVDKVILPATRTIADIINNDLQFRNLKDVLAKTGLNADLSNAEGHWTLFAPTDGAFDKLDAKMKEKIVNGNGCSSDIMQYHILPNVICSGVVDSKAKTVNNVNKYVVLERDEQDNILIDGVKVIMTDIVASNGVIHVIDDIIVPESSRDIPQALEDNHMNTFKELFDIAGLTQDQTLSNVTIFAPSEKALSELPESFLSGLKSDPEKLKEFLQYHIATPKTYNSDFADNTLFQSGLPGKSLRMNKYGGVLPMDLIDPGHTPVTVQCARVSPSQTEVCGGVINTVNKVLLPPGGPSVEIMSHNDKYKKFSDLIKFAEMETELNSDGPYTIFAPTDAAFDGLKEDIKTKISEDKETAKKVIKHHVLKGHLCCAGIQRRGFLFDTSNKKTIGGDLVSVRKSSGGYLYVDRGEIITCDMVADNGVVHGIDRVLLPIELEPEQVQDPAARRHQVYGLDLADLLFNKK